MNKNNLLYLPFSITAFPKSLLELVPSIEICKLFKENNLFQEEENKTIFGWFKTHPVGNPEVLNFVSAYGKQQYEYCYPAPTLQELLKAIENIINDHEIDMKDNENYINKILSNKNSLDAAANFLINL